MSEENISLMDLLNLAIGTPRENVNYRALRVLLRAVLSMLDIRERKTPWRDTPPGEGLSDAVVGVTAPEQDHLHDTEEEQHRVESDISTEDDQWSLRSRIQTYEDVTSKAMQLLQELNNQKDKLEEELKELRNQKDNLMELRHQQKVEAEVSDVEKCCHRVEALEEAVRSVMETFQKYPDPEELSQCVTSDVMQSVLRSKGEDLEKELVSSEVVDPAKATNAPFNSNVTAVSTAPSHSSTPSSPHPADSTVRPAAPPSPTISGQLPAEAQATETPSGLSGPTQQTETGLMAASTPLTQKARDSKPCKETVEALRDISKLKERFNKQEACVASELTHLRELITNKGSCDESNNLMDQLNQQRALIDSLMSDRTKLDNLEDMFMNLTSPDREATFEAASGSKELRQPMSDLRISVQKLEEDVKQLKDKQSLTVERTTDLQDQLDNLRGMLEDVKQSLTSRLFEAGQDESDDSQGLGQSKERSAYSSSTGDTGRQISLLFQRYEQLQVSVNSLLQQQTGATAGPLKDRENVELASDVQKVILQLQAECEKLHETTRYLHDDNRQKQSHIEELYRTTEELQEKKADKQMVESELNKADSSDKVSCLQFDSAIEQLYAMFHEVLNKVTGQEQDWHKVIDRISTEMECKLNRIELDCVKKQLEDCWKNIHQKLQALEAPEHEGAAGLRKQLVDRFHCLSCDRPVVMHIPGQHLVKAPSTFGFPPPKSIKPKQISKMTDYNHPSVSRGCAGSHKVTSASQQRTSLQHMKHHTQTDVASVIQSEVDIIGQDGHIYKGCLYTPAIRNTENKLPTISTKNAADMCKTKDKIKHSLSPKPAASPEVHYPHSAKSAQCSRSASSISGRHWPVSTLGCMSQSSITPASAAAESNPEPHADETLNL